MEAWETGHTVEWRQRINDFDQKKNIDKKETNIRRVSKEYIAFYN